MWDQQPSVSQRFVAGHSKQRAIKQGLGEKCSWSLNAEDNLAWRR